MKKFDLKITPFGGVNEIGSNMTVFEFESKILIIDYGILFPYDDFYDINYLIVDYSALKKTEKEVVLFISHGHEDHIGAIIHFMKDFPQAQIHAPRFAQQLIFNKLDRDGLSRKVHLYDESLELGLESGYKLRPVHVTHSIPDTYGAILSKENEVGILFISDFKYDLNPLFEKPFDTEKIQKYFGSAKKRYAFLDSTNILNPNKTLSESDLTEELNTLLSKPKRTFITMFASNVYRMKNILEVCKRQNRKVTLIGRSLKTYLEAATECKLINPDDYPLKDFEAVENYNDPKMVYIVTGSQGEHLGATRRISIGEQKHINLNDQDQFIFSSKAIPGNEKKIYRIYNQISEYGAEIISTRTHKVHASGHPGQEDLRQLVNAIKPTDIFPIHGETYFLKEHVKFVRANFEGIKAHFISNFDSILIKEDRFSIIDAKPTDPILIHGASLPIAKEKISERRKLACTGLIMVNINSKTKNINIDLLGLPTEFDPYKVEMKDLAHYTAFQEYKNRDFDFVVEKIRIKMRNLGKGFLGYKPVTHVSMV